MISICYRLHYDSITLQWLYLLLATFIDHDLMIKDSCGSMDEELNMPSLEF